MSEGSEKKGWRIDVRAIVPLAYQAKQLHEDIGFLIHEGITDVPEWGRQGYRSILARARRLSGQSEPEYGHVDIAPNCGLPELYGAAGQVAATLWSYLTEEEKERRGPWGFGAATK
jgi:hypothetical protein